MISAARESESLVNDIFILAMVSTGISGHIGVRKDPSPCSGPDKTAVVAPADIATTPIAVAVAT